MAPIINSRVRKDCPATPAPSTTVVTKRPKTESSGSRRRVRVADFDELSKSLLEETISIYRAQIGGVQPYPDRLEDRDTATGAWVESCNARGVRVEFDEDMLKLVSLTILSFVVYLSGHSADHRPSISGSWPAQDHRTAFGRGRVWNQSECSKARDQESSRGPS